MSGPSAQYQGNPALQQMMLAEAMRQKGGLLPSMTPVGPPQTVTSEPVPIVPKDSPVQGAPLPDASTFTQQKATPSPQTALPAQSGPTLPPVSAQQMGNAVAALGNARSRPTPMQPVSADGSKPLADFSHNLDGMGGKMPDIAHRNGIDWKQLAGIVGPALMAAGGHPEVAAELIGQTRMLADEMGLAPEDLLKRRGGQALNAEQLYATRALVQKSRELVAGLAKKAVGGSDGQGYSHPHTGTHGCG